MSLAGAMKPMGLLVVETNTYLRLMAQMVRDIVKNYCNDIKHWKK